MTCHGYDMLIVCLSLITAISETLALLKRVECNGIVDFAIRMMVTHRRCADEDMTRNPTTDVELPNVRTDEFTDQLPKPSLNP